ncbi:MAG: hypothetical protein F6K62_11025 [Sphaerospermopsis sp. SIO1G2]|nr:hypothetical protein [Sphaerospermopsis sp. SIO1G2]
MQHDDQPTALDSVAGIPKGIEVVWNTMSGIGSVGSLLFGGSAQSVANQAQHATGGLFNHLGIGKIMGGAVLLTRLAQSAVELAHGDTKKAAGKAVRGVAEAGVVMLHLSGVMWIAEVVSKLATDKFLSTHVGDLAEHLTTELMTDETEKQARQKVTDMRSTPMGMGTVPAGYGARQIMPAGSNTQLTVGGLPPAPSVQIEGSQLFPKQVMPATYSGERMQTIPQNVAQYSNAPQPRADMSAGHWQRTIGRQPSNIEFTHGNMADAVLARQQAAQYAATAHHVG